MRKITIFEKNHGPFGKMQILRLFVINVSMV